MQNPEETVIAYNAIVSILRNHALDRECHAHFTSGHTNIMIALKGLVVTVRLYEYNYTLIW